MRWMIDPYESPCQHRRLPVAWRERGCGQHDAAYEALPCSGTRRARATYGPAHPQKEVPIARHALPGGQLPVHGPWHGPGPGGGTEHPQTGSGVQPQSPLVAVTHCSLAGQVPAQDSPAPFPQGSGLVAVVVEAVVVVVVVVGGGQLGPVPGAGQASQQLAQLPTVPCFAAQCAASFLILQVGPLAVVRQHVTAFGLPQMECDAHFFTTPAQLLFVRTAFACCAAQLT